MQIMKTLNLMIKKTAGIVLILGLMWAVLAGFDCLWAENPMKMQHVRGVLDPTVNAVYPAYYDLRQNGRAGRVKYRLSYFHYNVSTAYSSLESCTQTPNGKVFFEGGLGQFLQKYDNPNTRVITLEMIMAGLAAWGGPAENIIEYSHQTPGLPGSVINHVQQMILLPVRETPTDLNTIKWFIMNHGGVFANIMIYSWLMDARTFGYYHFGNYSSSDNYDQSVTIVGWDDNFPTSSFLYPPPAPGAFIVKDNIGETHYQKGYFYISYYDASFIPRAVFNNCESLHNYGTMYQHDMFGVTDAVGDGSASYWGANIFTASDDRPLEAVSFYTTDSHTTATIHVYRQTAPGAPSSGSLATVQNAGFIYPGYYTVKLEAPVPLQKGESFSVAVRFQNSAYTFPVCIETPVARYSSGAASLPGQSFISSDGQNWRDLTVSHPNGNVCIKAFSAYSQLIPTPPVILKVEPVIKRTWVLKKAFARLELAIPGISGYPVTGATIWKKSGPDIYKVFITITPQELASGTFVIMDEALDPKLGHYYHAAVYTEDPRSLGKSTEIYLAPVSY